MSRLCAGYLDGYGLSNFRVAHQYQNQFLLHVRSGHVQKHTKNNYLGEINRQKIYQKSF